MNEDQLCQAVLIAKREKLDQSYMYIVTQVHPHICNDTTTITPPRSRKSPFTSKQMATAAMPFIRLNPFQTPGNVGDIVSLGMQLKKDTLTYQNKARVKKYCTGEYFGSRDWQYATLLSRLELIKKYDPDCHILLIPHAMKNQPIFRGLYFLINREFVE